ncbi:MAG: DUF393 domain-containing protein [Euryarchaeota archaeon]|nr:DUF393 domain-containing protein [Euryarchaeota archaeon]
MAQAYLLYDGTCRVCTLFKDAVVAADLHHRITSLRLEDPQTARRYAPRLGDLYPRMFHLDVGGRLYSGPRAIPRLLELLPLGGPTVAIGRRIPGSTRLTEVLYRLAASLRPAGCRCGLEELQREARA